MDELLEATGPVEDPERPVVRRRSSGTAASTVRQQHMLRGPSGRRRWRRPRRAGPCRRRQSPDQASRPRVADRQRPSCRDRSVNRITVSAQIRSRRRRPPQPRDLLSLSGSPWSPIRCALMRVLLVDDHEVVRQGLRALLESNDDIEVVGEAGTVADAVRRVGFDEPDVVVMDVRLPDGSGVDACRRIRSRFPEVRVLMLTTYADETVLTEAITAGASGYVLKRIDSDGSGGQRPPGRGRRVAPRRRDDRQAVPEDPQRLRSPARSVVGSRAQDPLADRRRQDQPPDRRRPLPVREDDQELRLHHVHQAGDEPAFRGGRLPGPSRGVSPPPLPAGDAGRTERDRAARPGYPSPRWGRKKVAIHRHPGGRR